MIKTKKRTPSKKGSSSKKGSPSKKEIDEHMNEIARRMNERTTLLKMLPVDPGQKAKNRSKLETSIIKTMLPEVKRQAQKDKEKKLEKDFKEYYEKAMHDNLLRRLNKLNKTKKRSPSPKKSLQNQKTPELDLEDELGDIKWGGKKRIKGKTQKHRNKRKTQKHKKKRKTRKN